MVEFRLLGEIRLIAGDGADVDSLLRQPKRLALLAYLATPAPGTWHRRDMLVALFWPEFDTSHARTSLRNALYVIRQALGDTVIRARGDDEISVDPSGLQTDLATVLDALRNGRTEDALSAYRGDLLPGLYPADSDGFHRWLDSERTRLKTAVTTAATQRIDTLERGGATTQALDMARRVMEIQPDDETLVRRVMLLHEANGDRAGALGVFEGYRSRLAADFEAEPAPETTTIAERLRAPVVGGNGRFKRASSNGFTPAPIDSPVTAHASPVSLIRRTQSRSRTMVFVVAAALAISLLAAGAWSISQPSRPQTLGASTPLTADEDLQVEVAISPNARLVAYAKGNRSRLRIFVHRISGADAWPLTSDSAVAELMPRWSPDNDRLLFLSRANAYVAPLIGGVPRLVARGTPGDGMIRSASWSPDGDSIAIVRNDSLMVQSLSGSGTRFVGRGSQIHSCVWSPSRTWIACIEGNWVALEPGPLFGNEAPSAVVLFPAAGGASIDVTGRQFQHRSPSWSSNGKFLWLISDRDGEPGEVYATSLGEDGRADGPFIRVGLKAEAIDLASSTIAYSVPFRRANIWSTPIPRDNGLKAGNATRVTSGTQLIEVARASRDGKWLVYDSNRHGNADLFRISTAGGPAERLTDNPDPEYAGALSPDGRDVAFHRWVKGQRHLFVKRLDTGVETEILPVPGDQSVPDWSPDGRSIAAWSHEKERGSVFVLRRKPDGTWNPAVWRLEAGQLPMWSPDGRSLSIVRYDGGIDVIDTASSSRREVYRRRAVMEDPVVSNIVWSPDGSVLWFIGSDARGNGGIWSVPASGGRPRLRVDLGDSSGRLHGPMLTSDGNKFYFTLDERFSNVRVAALVPN